VMMPALIAGTPVEGARRRANQLLERVGLAERLTHKPGELSGGEQQRVAVARALVQEPRAVLADEPTGNLDTAAGAAVVALLQELNRHGTTIAVITHNHDVAAAMRRRIELKDGRITGDSGAAT